MFQQFQKLLRSPLLFPRLTRWLLALLVIIAAIQFAAVLILQRRFIEHTVQVMNTDLADALSEQLRPHVGADSIDMASLSALLEQFQRHGPMHGYYLLDGSGRPLLTSTERIRLQQESIPLDPVRRFLSKSSERTLPIFGADPLVKGRAVPFSAAQLRDGATPLYLYITLQSARSDLLYRALIDREAPIIGAITFVAALAFAGAASLLFSLFFVRRLERMRSTLERFGAGDADARDGDGGDDELSFLSRSFNGMADTISAQMRRIREQEENRRELVQNICHDLRTPLTSARGYLETVEIRKDRLTDAERDRYLAIVDQNLGFMQSMAEELFDLSSLEADDRPLDLQIFDLRQLAAETVEKLRHTTQNPLILDQPEEACPVLADRPLLLRVVTNLVQNAIRYTPESGSVTVALRRESTRTRLAVIDTGIGIAPADQERIFARFYRTDRARMMNAKGSGLGLAIVKRILELHYSQIELKSEEGRGSEFAFSLDQR